MNWTTSKTAILLWLLLLGAGLGLWLSEDKGLLGQKDIAFDANYKGLLFTNLTYGNKPYAKAITAAYFVGAVLNLPLLLFILKKRDVLVRNRDYSGNHISKSTFEKVLKNYKRFSKKKTWKVQVKDRNQIWVGVDLLTKEDVYMSEEDIFKGTLILGAQGMGKTSRIFKVILKQLALDPAEKTSFVVFTLKAEDSREFLEYLQEFGHNVFNWGMTNLINLCINKMGGINRETLHGYLQGAAQASGLSNAKDPFWINSSISRMVDYILNLQDEAPTLGNAFAKFKAQVKGAGADARMDQGLLETVSSVFGAMTDPASRASILHSPNHGGGLHLGPVVVAPHTNFRRIVNGKSEPMKTGDKPEAYPHGLYEFDNGARLPFNWYDLLNPTSVILPPPGKSKPELFALNFIKASLLGWMSEDISSTTSQLLKRDPVDRHRIVLAQDEGHSFLSLDGNGSESGFSDTKALAENRQAGLVSIYATQSASRLNKTTRDKLDDFLSVVGTYIFMGVNGEEREKVLKMIGKVNVTRIKRSYGRNEAGNSRTVTASGGFKSNDIRSNVNESIQNEKDDFISAELYGQFRQGMAIFSQQGQPHRIIFTPFHDRVKVNYRGTQ